MSSKSQKTRACRASYGQRINLNIHGRTKRRLPKSCHNCTETNDCVKLFSMKVNRIEEIVGDFKNRPKKKPTKLSMFNAKFTLNNVPCELEYDLSNFTLEDLQKLVIFTTNYSR
jgi:hypothetical protein